MLNTPAWIIDILETEDFRCPQCKTVFNKDYISACGLRKSHRDIKKQVLYVEYNCKKCQSQPIYLELYDLDFDEFAFLILDDVDESRMQSIKEKTNKMSQSTNDMKSKAKPRKKKKMNFRKSKITQKELDSARKFLSECDYHQDFLDILGMHGNEEEKKKNETQDK